MGGQSALRASRNLFRLLAFHPSGATFFRNHTKSSLFQTNITCLNGVLDLRRVVSAFERNEGMTFQSSTFTTIVPLNEKLGVGCFHLPPNLRYPCLCDLLNKIFCCRIQYCSLRMKSLELISSLLVNSSWIWWGKFNLTTHDGICTSPFLSQEKTYNFVPLEVMWRPHASSFALQTGVVTWKPWGDGYKGHTSALAVQCSLVAGKGKMASYQL